MSVGTRAVALAVTVTTFGNLPVWLLTGLAPQVSAELEFGDAALGVAVASFFGFTAFVSLPAGRLVERVGWKRGMVLAAAATATALVGLSTVPSFAVLLAFLLVGSIGFSIAQPCANLALAHVIAVHRQGTAFGIKQSSLPLTGLLVGATVPLFSNPGGWRWAYVVSAVLVCLYILVLVVDLVRSRDPSAEPSNVWRLRVRRRGKARSPAVRPRPALIVLAAAAGLGAAATLSIGGFVVVYGVASGLTAVEAGQLLAASSVLCLTGRLVSGYVADLRGRRHLLFVAIMMAAGCVGLALLSIGGHVVVVVIGTLLAFGVGWSWNGVFAFAVVLNHQAYPATATGVVQTAMGAGGAVGPLLFGFVAAQFGYAPAWAGALVAMAGASLCVLQARRMIARASDG